MSFIHDITFFPRLMRYCCFMSLQKNVRIAVRFYVSLMNWGSFREWRRMEDEVLMIVKKIFSTEMS